MFKIGDFSRLTMVSIRMLRHYDEIGLLKPESIDNFTGYRFYSAEQIPTVNKIQLLKEMGFSLSEICGLMESNLSSKQLISLLENKKREIKDVIEIEQDKLLRVEGLIKFINREDINMKYDIAIKSIPAYKVISLREVISEYKAEGELWKKLHEYADNNNIKVSAPFYAIYHDVGFKESDVDVEITMCVNDKVKETSDIKVKELEAVHEMAIVFHKGPFEEMTSAYRALAIWMAESNYEMCGATRAIYHKGHWCESNPENYLTEIQVPICKKK